MSVTMMSEETNSSSLLLKVAEFAQTKVRDMANELDHTEAFPQANISALAQMGALGIPFPVQYGGQGKSMREYTEAIRLLAKECGATAGIVLTHTSLASWPIYQFGTEIQREKYLRPLLEGKTLGALAMSEESSGSEGMGIQTAAIDKGDYWEISGRKRYVSNAGHADTYVIVASTDSHQGREGLSLFLLEKGMQGLVVGGFEQKMGLRALPVAELLLDKVKVPKDNLLGEINQGYQHMQIIQQITRVAIAAQAVGLAQGAMERALAYVGKRRQFGGRLIDLQNTQFKLAEASAQIAASQALVEKVAAEHADGQNTEQSAAMAKLVASRTAVRTAETAIQVTGGFGYMRTHEIERYSRDAKLTELYGGTSETQKTVIASPWLQED